MLDIIKNRTREDWQLFDSYRSIALQPTQEEIQQLEQQELQNMIFVTQWYLALYGIEFTGNETDCTQLYTLYLKWNWTNNNWDMKEWVGNDSELQRILNEQIEKYNNIKDFCQFIISYER